MQGDRKGLRGNHFFLFLPLHAGGLLDCALLLENVTKSRGFVKWKVGCLFLKK
jgi:hypothetical protein